ncbi:MAG: response regulator [Clostridiales bacterium]|nr:response regulator [Clostridiales bacterium]
MDDRKDKPWILIVDDVEANRFVLRNIIADMGYQPVLAENGVQALKVVERHAPQLILLDVSMPEMDGYEFCRIMKDDVKTRDIPILFISAYDEPGDITTGFALGGEDYITKPFIQEVVQARVHTHLELHEAVRDLAEANRRLQASVNEQLSQMEKEKQRVLYALVSVARRNASYEEDHMERLQYNCKVFAQAMQLSPKYESIISDSFVETIFMAAPLCDLGNVAIPSEILSKEGSLTHDERDLMRTHTTVGAEILQDIIDDDYNDFIQMALEIAHYHHENWDGTGYPCGLSGDDIPISAQIVSLISAYCALTEDRTYRKAYSSDDTIEILELVAGTKFKQDLYDICKKIYRQLK